jgi:dihydrofolate reductase
MITLIAAVNHNMLLGKDNKMPWHIKEDLVFFKEQTINKTVLMGRKTFESIKGVLPNRTIYVLTSQTTLSKQTDRVHLIHDVKPLIEQFKQSTQELMVAGGGMVYRLLMPYANRILLSVIDDDQHGDVYFPTIDMTVFYEYQRIDYDTFEVIEYRRKS